ncbi:MAG: ion transporter [Bdellovibrionaceae bacterium]|nr:ion transporter [Bdellovibrionales bacterium]MCB9083762.1 ion transporter [Pseudobdellovibrionaceae bacterium]
MRELREKLHRIIFEAETSSGRAFDVTLIILVVLSVAVVMMESVDSVRREYLFELTVLEWVFTILFTVEYLLRLFCVHRPLRYVFSFFGLVDFFSIVPTYLSLIFPGVQGLLIIRGLRLLRVFRVLKLQRYTHAGGILQAALHQSRHKITVFLGVVVTMVFIIGTIMYLVEGRENGFTSIPKSVYWAIVTMTTVGYGDIAPQTPLGQLISSLLMIAGYGIIAVPTGIVSVEMANVTRKKEFTRTCRHCTKEGHDYDAKFCNECGQVLD